MQLKNYQQQAIEQLDRWLDALKQARLNGEKAGAVLAASGIDVPEALKNYPRCAWQGLKDQNTLPGIPRDGGTAVPDYICRTAASGQPIPHVCLKVPTGGGKTLLGVVALGRLKQETGFVLWMVPTRAIYEQTIKAFKTREDYADKITTERVRRVIKGVPKAKDDNLKNGLGGSFAYYALGEAMSIENMLTGKNLPGYEALARHLVYTASGQSPHKLNPKTRRGKDGMFYEAADKLYYLIYQPNLDFLRSADSALNSTRAERIAKQAKAKKKTAVVFATHKFIGQKALTDMGIEFCGLPYTISSG